MAGAGSEELADGHGIGGGWGRQMTPVQDVGVPVPNDHLVVGGGGRMGGPTLSQVSDLRGKRTEEEQVWGGVQVT